MRDSKYARSLRIEPLEARRLMAGDVSVKVSKGQLTLRGNGLDNAVGIFAGPGVGEFIVRGLDGTLVNRGSADVTLDHVTKKIVLRLGNGNDRVSLTDFSFGEDVLIVLGDGHDQVRLVQAQRDFAPEELGPVEIGGRLIVEGGDGNDQFSLAAVRVRESALLVGAKGNDAVTLSDAPVAGLAPQPVQVDDRLTVALGPGDNSLVAQRSDLAAAFSLQVGGNLLFSAADGQDSVTLDHVSLGNYAELSTGGGNDTANVTAVQAARLSINSGSGDDTASVNAAQVEKLRVLLGAGDDSFTVQGSTAGTEAFFDAQGNLDTFDDLGSNLWADFKRKRFETIL